MSLSWLIVKSPGIYSYEYKTHMSMKSVHHHRPNRWVRKARGMRSNSRIPRSYLHAQSLTAKPTGIEGSRKSVVSELPHIKPVGKRTSTAAVVGSRSKGQIANLRWRAGRDEP